MRKYLSSKDFSINFTLLLLPIEKSILNFFKKRLVARDSVSSNIALPLYIYYFPITHLIPIFFATKGQFYLDLFTFLSIYFLSIYSIISNQT